MKPINQSILHNPDTHQLGNCLQAAVASILELSLDDTPNFNQIAREQYTSQWLILEHWLIKEYGLISKILSVALPFYCIASGISQRGFYHSCVYFDGHLEHDPHPDKTGLSHNIRYCYFVPPFLVKGI